ncbi:DUF1572 domain-containing protein [Solitalea sp. MAHUQ-68]|uniref:DUF1572 domain-containing protein n=1 Tax=Solitalea agri TaxID=2953739 RepID=A0A9X2JCS2_9SPHI|nr:DUF1572 family protein [Solitalea agri]MCO4293378.1 DUF1572 domain-containing protein [Solitalea agri]
METIGQVYLENIKKVFASQKDLAERTFAQLTEQEMHFTPDENTNSIAIQIQHISGNMKSRFTDFFTSDGEKPNRNRDAEFNEQQLSTEKLLKIWEEGWLILTTLLSSMDEKDLLKTVFIRAEAHTALDAINRQVNHYAYHVGQIVQLGKLIKKGDWISLSIPKNKSAEYNSSMINRK